MISGSVIIRWCELTLHTRFFFQASSSSASIAHQPKGSSGTDTGPDLTSGSDTEATPTALEQTLSPQLTKKRESGSIDPSSEKPTKTFEDAPRELPKDSPSENKAMDKTPAPAEDVPKAAEVLSPLEARVSAEVAPASATLLHESENTMLVKTEVNPVPLDDAARHEANVAPSGPSSTGVTANAGEPVAPVNPKGAVSTEGSGPSGIV